jgi:hypothetical protein
MLVLMDFTFMNGVFMDASLPSWIVALTGDAG